jgi:hypothetical protein
MARQTGITADSYKRFVIDAGKVTYGFTDFTTVGTLLGATRGGSTLSIEQEIKDMVADGAPGVVKGGRRVTKLMAKLTVNLLEHTLVNWTMLLPGATSATAG